MNDETTIRRTVRVRALYEIEMIEERIGPKPVPREPKRIPVIDVTPRPAILKLVRAA